VRYSATLPRTEFERILRSSSRAPRSWVFVPSGISRAAGGTELIARGLQVEWHATAPCEGPGLLVGVGEEAERAVHEAQYWPSMLDAEERTLPLMLITVRAEGSVQGRVLHGYQPPAALDALKLVGPGMHVLAFQNGWASAPASPGASEHRRWSRLIGALGATTWQRLTGLRYAVIGVGRNGSLAATSLARMGAMHL
jgi:hypothetical protein